VKLIVKTVMNGRLAPQLQNEVTKRGMAQDSNLLAWLAALIDKESLDFLLVLNSIPKSVSGLINPINPGGTVGDVAKWYPKVYNELTDNDIIQAHLYTAVTEQLTRLDALLRQTQVIASAIEKNAFGYSSQVMEDMGWCTAPDDWAIQKPQIIESLPKMARTHPVVKASSAEMDRISKLLTQLRTGDKGHSSPSPR
jgi:hypothetical protein